MTTLTLTLPLPPLLNRIYRPLRTGGKALTNEAREYKAEAAWEAICYLGRRPKLTGQLAIEMTVYRKRSNGDIDAFTKLLFDAMNDVLWLDDGQIKQTLITLEMDRFNPRVELKVWQL